MRNDLMFDAHPLARGGIRRIRRGLGRRVECVSGSLWVTQDGDPRDVVLEVGEAFTLDASGDALISALDDSRYLLLEACRPAPATSFASGRRPA